MKKIILSSIALLLTIMLVAQPGQEGPPKPPPLTERWKRDSIKLNLYVAPPASQMANIQGIFYSFYKELDTLMGNNKTAPPVKEVLDKIKDNRKDALQKVLPAPVFDRFETFEQEFMPPPPPPHGHPGMPGHLRRPEQAAPTPNT